MLFNFINFSHKMMFQRVIAVVLALIVCIAAIEGGAITRKRSAEEYGEGFENGLARVSHTKLHFIHNSGNLAKV